MASSTHRQACCSSDRDGSTSGNAKAGSFFSAGGGEGAGGGSRPGSPNGRGFLRAKGEIIPVIVAPGGPFSVGGRRGRRIFTVRPASGRELGGGSSLLGAGLFAGTGALA